MFKDNSIRKSFEGEVRYDKMAIASTLVGVSFEGATCSLIEGQIIKDCEHCNLRYICKKIDEVVEDYTDKTTIVTGNFRFQ